MPSHQQPGLSLGGAVLESQPGNSMKPRTPIKAAAYGMDDDKDKGDRGLLGLRKKGMGVRTWLLIGIDGGAQVVEAGKHAIMRRAGLPGRDLRILDPMLSYPSTILGRERAIVLNLEHIKAIITAQEVLLLNSKDPAVAPFVADLQGRLPLHFDIQEQQQRSMDGGSDRSDNEDTKFKGSSGVNNGAEEMSEESQLEANGFLHPNNSPVHHGPNSLPFEFRALEACLEATCSCLDAEANILDKEAYPALDLLTSQISTLNLERVRQIKSRLVAISGRVQKVRDEIEKLLDDDGDMAEMYLTDKLMRQQLDGHLSPASTVGGYNPVSDVDLDGTLATTPILDHVATLKATTSFAPDGSDDEAGSGDESEGMNPAGSPVNMLVKEDGRSSSTSSSSSSSSDSKVDVEELEMLLEAYFVQIDGTLNKLSTLRDYVDDTEDYINIMLDDKQNHLLQMGVMLTTATLVLSLSIVVTGIFGMNIHIHWFDESSYTRFSWVVAGSVVASLLIYFIVIGWCKWKHLLE